MLNQLKKLTRRPVIFGLAAVLAAALCIPTLLREQPAQAAAAITNWGLSFQQPGKTPTGNASAEYLSDFDAYFVAPEEQNGEKAIYLTFDCGYENGCTAPILDALKKHNVLIFRLFS